MIAKNRNELKMRHAYFHMMTLLYMTLKTKNPNFLKTRVQMKLSAYLSLSRFHTKVWQEMIGTQLRNCDFFLIIYVRDTIQIQLKGSWKVDFE